MTYVESRSKLARSTPAKFPLRGRSGPLKHVLSAKTIDLDQVDDYCRMAEAFESRAVSAPETVGKTIALLFFQPSTRTRLGFESATVALGAHTIGMEDMSGGSRTRTHGRTQESLEDCAAVVSRLCDAIVVRHYETGAAARMAAKSATPVINAGDGWNEHPTQALIDIYALRRGLGTIRGKSIAIGGDPRGRTVRSLIQLLRFEAAQEIVFCAPPHIPVPADVLAALAENQVRYRMVGDIEDTLKDCDALMMAPYDMSEIGEPAASGYVPPNQTPDSFVITPEKIERAGSQTLLYHPLPRLEEIHPSCDVLPNAMYFEQVRLSKFMRMAVLYRVLSAS
jgi:aspartate carbamoyltransferase catalytic subunit